METVIYTSGSCRKFVKKHIGGRCSEQIRNMVFSHAKCEILIENPGAEFLEEAEKCIWNGSSFGHSILYEVLGVLIMCGKWDIAGVI